MAKWKPPTRYTSTGTTFTVNSDVLPSWLPAPGYWKNVNLPAATPRARADSTVAGTHGQGGYFSSNRFGGQNPWYDYTGGMWNPYLSTHGAWCVRGGGHATSRSMLDTGTYVWNTGDRLWERYSDPVYPGDVPVEVPGFGWAHDDQMTVQTAWTGTRDQLSDPKWANFVTYGELTSNPTDGYIPCADHNRMGMVFVRPGLWGMGPKGGLILACVNSAHVSNHSLQAHIFSFDTRKWARLANNVANNDGKIGVSACIDAVGNLYHSGPTPYAYDFRWLPHGASTWIYRTPSNWVANAHPHSAMVWVPGWAVKNTSGAIAVLRGHTGNTSGPEVGLTLVNLDATSWSCTFPGGGAGMTGTLPAFRGGGGDTWASWIWVDDIGALCMWSPQTGLVYAVYPPTNPLTQNWSSTVMTATGSCGVSLADYNSAGLYNKFQYAPALKAFFIVGNAATDDMWCFKPLDSAFPQPSWVTTIQQGEYASIPIASGKRIQDISPTRWNTWANGVCSSYSGLSWNDEWGQYGGMLLTGGGHAALDPCPAWVFDASLPGWVELNVRNLPHDGDPYAWTYAEGSEYSRTAGNIPGYTAYGEGYFRRQGSDVPTYPFSDLMNYGECATGVPPGFHTYNYIYPLRPGELGTGLKGGWAWPMQGSNTGNSGVHTMWGHKIDGATGVFSRVGRIPDNLGYGNYGAAWAATARVGSFAYTTWGGDFGAKAIVKTDLTTGAVTGMQYAVSGQGGIGTANNRQIIPGTTLLVALCPPGSATASGTFWSSGYVNGSLVYPQPGNPGRLTLRVFDLAGANTQPFREVTINNNTIPSVGWYFTGTFQNGDPNQPIYEDPWDANRGWGQMALMWVPEVGKFAVFGQQTTGNLRFGDIPLTIYWITPPANVQANWLSQPWTMEEETLTVKAGDTKAGTKDNRGPYGFTYQCCFWSSRLRCFVHIPSAWNDMCFFFRTRKVA